MPTREFSQIVVESFLDALRRRDRSLLRWLDPDAILTTRKGWAGGSSEDLFSRVFSSSARETLLDYEVVCVRSANTDLRRVPEALAAGREKEWINVSHDFRLPCEKPRRCSGPWGSYNNHLFRVRLWYGVRDDRIVTVFGPTSRGIPWWAVTGEIAYDAVLLEASRYLMQMARIFEAIEAERGGAAVA